MPDRRAAPAFIVYCRSFSGAEKAYCRYSDADSANAVAARLSEIGCPARVVRVRVRRPRIELQSAEIAEHNAG